MSIGNGAPAWPSVIVSNGGIAPAQTVSCRYARNSMCRRGCLFLRGRRVHMNLGSYGRRCGLVRLGHNAMNLGSYGREAGRCRGRGAVALAVRCPLSPCFLRTMRGDNRENDPGFPSLCRSFGPPFSRHHRPVPRCLFAPFFWYARRRPSLFRHFVAVLNVDLMVRDFSLKKWQKRQRFTRKSLSFLPLNVTPNTFLYFCYFLSF